MKETETNLVCYNNGGRIERNIRDNTLAKPLMIKQLSHRHPLRWLHSQQAKQANAQ